MSLRNSKLRRRRYNDRKEELDYEAFVQSLVPHCHCDFHNSPCEGLLCGGPCDQMRSTRNDDEVDDDMTLEEQYNRCM